MRIVKSSDQLMQQTGQGDAHVFSPLDTSGMLHAIQAQKNDEALQRKLQADKEAKKSDELAEFYKYKGPAILDQHYVPTIENEAKSYLDDVADTYAKNGQLTPEDRIRLAQRRNSIEYKAQKLNALKSRMDSDIQAINKYPDYFDKEKLSKDRILKFHPQQDANGNVDISSLNPDEFKDNLASYIKEPELYKTLTKDIQKSIESGEYYFGEDIQGKETGSLFWKPEIGRNGQPTGRRVPGVSEDTIDFYLQHPDVLMSANNAIDMQLAENAEKLKSLGDRRSLEEIQSSLGQNKDVLVKEYVRNQLENVNEVSNKRTLSPGRKSGGDDEDKVKLTDVYDTEENYNLNKKGSDKNIVPLYSPHEIRIGGKDSEKPIFINAKQLIDPNTNSIYKDGNGNELVGDKEIVVSRMRLLPYNKAKGRIQSGGSEAIKKMNQEDLDYKWYVTGVMETKDKSGHTVKKPVIIPYDQVQGDLKTKRGFDLDDRDPDQYSDTELKSLIRREYADLSPEEKAKKFLQLRGKL